MPDVRVSWARVVSLADRLSERDKEIIRSLNTVGLLTGAQLERLTFSHHPIQTRNHVRRRVLKRLSRLGLVATLERRIGGVRAGSNGLVYSLCRIGQRMADLLEGIRPDARTRTPRTPGLAFLAHTLAVSETFVSLTELSRLDTATVRTFLNEPNCWWADGNGGMIRPDALIRVENDSFEAVTWLEVDQGTEHLGRIRSKLAIYERFVRSGSEAPYGLLPRVLFAATDDERVDAIKRQIARQGLQNIVCEAVRQPFVAAHIFNQLGQ